jgi:hypothetical protein
MNLQASISPKSLATVDYANLLQPIGVDIGNGQLKLVTTNGETRTDSYVHYLTERSTDTVKGYVEYQDGDRSDLIGKQWIGGLNAYYNGLNSIYRVTDDKQGKPQLGLQIMPRQLHCPVASITNPVPLGIVIRFASITSSAESQTWWKVQRNCRGNCRGAIARFTGQDL